MSTYDVRFKLMVVILILGRVRVLQKCFIAIIITMLGISNAIVAKAESVYEESLTLYIGVTRDMYCIANIVFKVSSLNGPFSVIDFTGEFSFVNLYVECNPSIVKLVLEGPTVIYTFNYSTMVKVCLNRTRLTGFAQGKIKADVLKRKFENLFDVFLFYEENASQFLLTGIVEYYYISEVPVVDKLWNAFLKQEYPGFSELFSANLNIRNMNIRLRLDKIGDQHLWLYEISGFGGRLFPISFNKEYTVSVNEILGHVGAIGSAPGASSSNIVISLHVGKGNYTFVPLETAPEMTKTLVTPEQIIYQTDIAGSSCNDIKIRFKIIESGDNATTVYVAAIILGAFSCITGIFLLRRHRPKSYR